MSNAAQSETVKVEVHRKFSPFWEGGPVDLDEKAFLDWAGGEVAVALFKGELKEAIWRITGVAKARAQIEFHKQLIDEADAKKASKKS